jgi:hypothetical protein
MVYATEYIDNNFSTHLSNLLQYPAAVVQIVEPAPSQVVDSVEMAPLSVADDVPVVADLLEEDEPAQQEEEAALPGQVRHIETCKGSPPHHL